MNSKPSQFFIAGVLFVLALAGCSNVLSNNPNRAPSAVVASTDYTIAPGQSVSLDAGSSNDLDNQSLGYVWSIISAPTSGQYTLTGTTTAKPVFSTANMTNGVMGVYTAKVVVTDKYNLTDTKSVTIRVTEAITPSITNTTATVYPGVTSSPVGSAAYTGSTLGIGTFNYSWAYTSTTATLASYTLSSPSTLTPAFASSFYAAGAITSPTYTTPAYLGNYVLTLTATDLYGVSASTTTTITVADTSPTVTSLNPATSTANTGASVTLTGVAADVDTAGRNNLKTSFWAQVRGPVDHSLTVPSNGTDSAQSPTAVTGTDTVTLPTTGSNSGNGVFVVRWTVVDEYGKPAASTAKIVSSGNTQPVLSSTLTGGIVTVATGIASGSGTSGSPYVLTSHSGTSGLTIDPTQGVTNTDADTLDYTFTVTAGASSLSFNSTLYGASQTSSALAAGGQKTLGTTTVSTTSGTAPLILSSITGTSGDVFQVQLLVTDLALSSPEIIYFQFP